MKTIWRHVAAVGCFGLIATAASAQSLGDSPQPAEYPPSSFDGAQYVDSRGCAFVRAGVAGVVNWVPRVSRSRQLLCGFQPTLPAAAPTPEPTPTPAPRAPAPRTQVAQSAPAPAAPRPLAASVIPAAPRVVEPPKPRTLTRAEACAGRTGVQPNLVSRATGKPLDCGGSVVATVAPVAAPITAQPVTRSVNANACLAAISSGSFASSSGTHNAVRCGPQTQPITPTATRRVTAAPAQVAAPVRVVTPPAAGRAPVVVAPRAGTPTRRTTNGASTCLQAIMSGQGFYVSGDGRTIRCAPQSQSPSAGAPLGSHSSVLPEATQPLAAPIEKRRVASGPPAGFETVWDDGRLNPSRGVAVIRVAVN